MIKIEPIQQSFFEKYENAVNNASYYRVKEKWLTLYCGFYDTEEDCTYILRYRETLELYKENGNCDMENLLCKIEEKDFVKIEINAVSGYEKGKLLGT